jgi:4-amino-4-deoxy-L-arabinose transferase-like glycosyltransferase
VKQLFVLSYCGVMNQRLNLVSRFRQWDKHPAVTPGLSILWLVLLCSVAFFWHLGSTGLVDETEPLFAEAARQMTVTGDWVTPYFNGETRFDKPPLVYWLMAIAYQTIGVNTWSVRLPSALAATMLTVMGFYALRRYGFPSPGGVADGESSPSPSVVQRDRQRWVSAWIGAAAMALNGHTLVWARTGVSDMLLSGCMGTAMLAFFCGYAERDCPRVRLGWYVAFYVLTALAVLTKGPVGLVLPGLTILFFLAYTGNFWSVLFREMQVWWGLLLFLVITVPWYVLVIAANGQDYTDTFFGYHNFERFTEVVNNHSAPWYFYFIAILAGFFPWSVYLPVAIARLRFWRRSQWVQQPRSTHLGLFALIWFGVIFGFFTIAVTKLPSYVLPLMPAAAILVGLLWSDQLFRIRQARPWTIALTISHLVTIALCSGIAIVLPLSAERMDDDPAMPMLPEVIQQTNLLELGAIVWALVAIAMLVLLVRRQGQWIWAVQIVGFLAFLNFTLFPFNFVVDELRQAPLRELSAIAVEQQRPNEPIAMVGFSKPSVVFYTQQPVLYWSRPRRVISLVRQLGDRLQVDSVLVLGYHGKLRDTGLLDGPTQLLDETDVFKLVRVDLPLPAGLRPPPDDD